LGEIRTVVVIMAVRIFFETAQNVFSIFEE